MEYPVALHSILSSDDMRMSLEAASETVLVFGGQPGKVVIYSEDDIQRGIAMSLIEDKISEWRRSSSTPTALIADGPPGLVSGY